MLLQRYQLIFDSTGSYQGKLRRAPENCPNPACHALLLRSPLRVPNPLLLPGETLPHERGAVSLLGFAPPFTMFFFVLGFNNLAADLPPFARYCLLLRILRTSIWNYRPDS